MKKVFMAFIFAGLCINLFSVTVDGYAYLEGQSDHSGIEVFLQRTAPDTLFNYTVYTDSEGYYNLIIENGIYDITYYKSQYFKNETRDILLYSNMTLENVILFYDNSIHGSISGVIERGNYIITDDLIINLNDTVIIESGVIMEFATGNELRIEGTLIAQGAPADSIKFTALDSWWDGIVYDGRANDGIIEYCIIEKTLSCGLRYCRSVKNSSIRNNNGIGAELSAESQVIENCDFTNNSGKSIFDRGQNNTIKNCNFYSNNSTSFAIVNAINSK